MTVNRDDFEITTHTVKTFIRLRRRTRFRLWLQDRHRRLRLGRDGYHAYKVIEAEYNRQLDHALLFGQMLGTDEEGAA